MKTLEEMTDQEKIEAFSKPVYCKDYECAWNVSLNEGVHIKQHRTYVPLGDEEDVYKGICGRPEVALLRKVFSDLQYKHEVTTCQMRSSRKLKGHVDFTKLMPQQMDLPQSY